MDFFKVIDDSLIYIEENLDKKITLDSISKVFNTSKYYYHRLFSSVMGISLNNYIIDRKVNRAIELIYENKLSMTDIAYELDFGDQASFTKIIKKKLGNTPLKIKKMENRLVPKPIPKVIKRDFKNFNGNLISSFTLEDFQAVTIRGIAFEVDLGQANYKDLIREKADELFNQIQFNYIGESYMVYSNCQPGSTKFKALIGVPIEFETEIENTFTIPLPPMFYAKLKYRGDLLNISDIFESDFSHFLKITKVDPKDGHIELFQIFEAGDKTMENYDICVPINRLEHE